MKDRAFLEETKQDKAEESLSSVFTKELIRVGLVSVCIGPAFMPLDYWQQRTQTVSNPKTAEIPTTTTKGQSGSTRSILSGVGRVCVRSIQGAALKNLTLSQRGSLHDALYPGAKERIEEVSPGEKTVETGLGGGPAMEALTRTLTVSGILGFADTSVTHWTRNERARAMHQLSDSKYIMPKPSTSREFLRALWAGYPVRLISNVATVAGLLATGHIKARLAGVLPTSTYVDYTKVAATLASAGLVGPFTNALSVLYTNQVIQTCPKTFKTPSVVKVVRDIGPKALTNGFGVSIAYTTVAYFAVPYIETIADKVITRLDVQLKKGATPHCGGAFAHSVLFKPVLDKPEPVTHSSSLSVNEDDNARHFSI